MDVIPVDGKENPAYGVNYPAALITIFGGSSPTGKLPVDVYSLDADYKYTDEILYPFGYGLSYKSEEPVPETTTASTASTTGAKTTATASNKTTAASTTKASTSSPKTGSTAPALAAVTLMLAGSTAFVSRKKK